MQLRSDCYIHFLSSVSGSPKQSPIGWVVGAVFVTLLVVGVILAFLVFTGCIKLSCKEDKKKPNTDPSTKEALSKSAEDVVQTE